MNRTDKPIPDTRAAAYLRMFTDHQQYSTSNQLEVIRECAKRRGLTIGKVYSDEGKSGLNLQGREALAQLIREVQSGQAEFSCILVYDVSRWGRFQDSDEAAHYEFLCRQAGVAVHYCAEQFEDDGGLTSTIAKSFKRAMAGEFSRELSTKVFAGATRGIRMGYKQGGVAIFGLRRMLVDQNDQPKGMLNHCEQKSLQSDRVIYVPGPAEEIEAVRWIFATFVSERIGHTELARRLNQRGLLSPSGRPWTMGKIRDLLKNESYIGNLVYARRTSKLGSRNIPNPPDLWVRREQAFEGIIPRELFFQAQEVFTHRRLKYKFTEAEMLEKLRVLLQRHGYLHSDLLNGSPQTPNATAYAKRFGSLVAAYRRIGYSPLKGYRPAQIQRSLGQINQQLIGVLRRQIESRGATVTWNGRQRTLVLNEELRVWVVLVRHNLTRCGFSHWLLRRHCQITPDLTMALRMDRNNEGIQDYYLLPALEKTGERVWLAEQNGIYLDAYRFESLDFLVGMAARTNLAGAKLS
jgi:DNA invertase Pin-like site-specific DNA recombinase